MNDDFVKENNPLQWPDGWPRTRFQDREAKSAWKKNYVDSVNGLVSELKRLGATSCLITRNDRYSEDAGIAVYFSLKPINNYGWQEALDLTEGTMNWIKQNYRELTWDALTLLVMIALIAAFFLAGLALEIQS